MHQDHQEHENRSNEADGCADHGIANNRLDGAHRVLADAEHLPVVVAFHEREHVDWKAVLIEDFPGAALVSRHHARRVWQLEYMALHVGHQ